MIIAKVPGINGLGKTKGCENAPNEILDKVKDVWSNEKLRSVSLDGVKIEEAVIDVNNLGSQQKAVYGLAMEIFNTKDKAIFLGGDHSVSLPIGKAFLDSYTDCCLIVFDAHPDLMPPMKEPSHEEWLRALIESGFPVENILLVGARNFDIEETRFLKEQKIKMIKMNDLLLNLDDVTDTIMEFSNGKNLYVSLDIDFIDPAFAPGTGYSEPGGVSAREAVYIFSRLALLKNLKALDLVEVNPGKDDGRTVKLAAKIISEFL
jgi:agmatinase